MRSQSTRVRVARRAMAASILLACAAPASAHTIVGGRLFPATLTVDDPGVNDELALPTFSYLTLPNGDGTFNQSFGIGGQLQKTITPTLSLSIGSDGVTFQRNPRATGFANVETELKYVFYQNPEHEFIVSGAVNAEFGGTGSAPTSSLPADPFSTITPRLFVGKGFGDARADWLRPFAVTAEVDYAIPTVGTNSIDGSPNPTVITWGGTLQYSLLYKNSNVSEVPDLFKRLVPAFEGIFSTPVSNTGPGIPGTPVHVTTGVVGPSLYYIGRYFEIGVMAQVPINEQSGRRVGALAILDIFLDDVAPDTIGKPLFGAAQAGSR